MRCSEAKRRLTEHWPDTLDKVTDQQLLEHLRGCPRCARQAAAIWSLKRDFAAARTHDLAGGLSLPALKTFVETSAASKSTSQRTKETSLMPTLINNLKRRPRLGVTLAAAAALAVLMTLVPFTVERTIGYEVAVAGVDKDLALDNSRVSALLTALGMEGAEVDVTDCAETCKLIVRELKSPEDADLVMAAFTSGENPDVQCEVRKICGQESGPLVMHARKVLVIRGQAPGDGQSAHEILAQRLGEACDGNAFVWMECLDDTMISCTIDVPGESGQVQQFAIQQAHADGSMPRCMRKIIVDSLSDSDCVKKCIMIQGDGGGRLHDLLGDLHTHTSEGQLSDEFIQQLRDKGCEVNIETSEDGTQKQVRIECDGAKATWHHDDDDATPAKSADEGDLPEEFVLDQNYPNPFNPTTTVRFSLPRTEHVTLDIYNVQGQIVRTLVNETRSAGEHKVEWDATSDNGERVASGIYFYRLTAGDYTVSRKMTLLK